ncbi:MAG TPA: NAD(P)H-hydrate epimerase [Nitrososphaeraceae archaeon]|jgi:NAD(P)H-hydrate epimerase
MTIGSNDVPITSDQMYRIEEKGHELLGMQRVYMMENAGHGIADLIVSEFKNRLTDKTKIVAVCGTGNNGGDCFVGIRHLAACTDSIYTIILLGHHSNLRSEEARINWNIISRMSSLRVIEINKFTESIKETISKADIILDGIFGTGIKGEIKDPQASAIDLINSSRAYTIAVDIPSGLDPTSGKADKKCIKADITITFHRLKKGLIDNEMYTGKVYVEHIGIPREAEIGIV